MVRLKLFPQPVRVTERTLMWRCADVLAWLENPPEAEPIDTPPPPSPELRRRKRAANSPLGAKGK
jgi:hypothetical protein